RLAHGALEPILPDVRDVQEGRTLQAYGNEGALHAGQDAGHPAKIDVAHVSLVGIAFEMQLLDRAALDQRHAGFEGGDVDEDVFCHGSRIPAWASRREVSKRGSPMTPV